MDKSLDTLDLKELINVEEAVIWQLATGEFVMRRVIPLATIKETRQRGVWVNKKTGKSGPQRL